MRHPPRRPRRAGRSPADAGTVVCRSTTLPGAVTADDDAARRDGPAHREGHRGAARRPPGPVLGPRPRPGPAPAARRRPRRRRTALAWTDLTPDAGRARWSEADHDVTPDGRTVVTTWRVAEPHGQTAARRSSRSTPPARRRTACCSTTPATPSTAPSPSARTAGGSPACANAAPPPTRPPDRRCVVVPARRRRAARRRRPAGTAGSPRWPGPRTRAALVVAADDDGRAPAVPRRPRHRRPSPGSPPTTAPTPTPSSRPDGTAVYALRTRRRRPARARPARPAHPDQQPVAAARARPRAALPGTLTEVTATAADGTPLRAWLVLPDGASAHGARAAAAVDPRRPAEQLERLALAVEPVGDGRPRLRGAAARPGPVHRIRAARSSPAAGAAGAPSRTPTSSRSPTRR